MSTEKNHEADVAAQVFERVQDAVAESRGLVEEASCLVEEKMANLRQKSEPVLESVTNFAYKRPVFFTFLSAFIFLSAIPIGLYIGFLIFAITAIGFICTCMFISSISAILFFGFFIITPILTFTCFLAIAITASLFGLFLAHRLYVLVRDNEFSILRGFSLWYHETMDRFGFGSSRVDGAPTSPVQIVIDDENTLSHAATYLPEKESPTLTIGSIPVKAHIDSGLLITSDEKAIKIRHLEPVQLAQIDMTTAQGEFEQHAAHRQEKSDETEVEVADIEKNLMETEQDVKRGNGGAKHAA